MKYTIESTINGEKTETEFSDFAVCKDMMETFKRCSLKCGNNDVINYELKHIKRKKDVIIEKSSLGNEMTRLLPVLKILRTIDASECNYTV